MSRSTHGHTVLCVFAVLAFLCPSALAQQPRKRMLPPPVSQEGEPINVFKGIEAAWSRGDAGQLSRYMPDSKVLLSVRGLGEKGGYYSKSQVFYLFKGMFKATKRQRIQFIKYHNVGKNKRKVYGVARRTFEEARSGRLYQDKVYVTLKLEGERWVVSEIKSTR